MFGLKTAGRVAVLAAALPLSGCAATFGGYDLAPSGLPRAEDELRRELAFEPEQAYASVLEGERAMPEDDLLRLLYAGMAGRYAGQLSESSHLLDLASYLAEDRVTTSVSQQLLSMVTSDRALSYVPGRTERIMIHYTAALNYLDAGDPDGAAVEARRIEALLDRLGEAGDGKDVSADARFLHLFTAAVFEAAGYHDAADVSRRRAGEEGSPATVLAHAATGENGYAADPAPVESPVPSGEVIVLVEHGFVPHRVEQSVAIVIPPWQMKLLTDGDAGEKAAAAAEAAVRILAAANHVYGDRSGYYRDRRWRHDVHLDPWDCDYGCDDRPDDDEEADGAPYLLRISWPVLFRESDPADAVSVRAGSSAAGADARLAVASGVRDDFDAERTTMIARTLVRAVSKVALTASAQSAVEDRDEVAGEVIGFLANLGTMLSERADTRSWHLLPGNVSMARLQLPEGSHDVTIELDGGRTVPLGPVRVESGRTAIVTHRVWR